MLLRRSGKLASLAAHPKLIAITAAINCCDAVRACYYADGECCWVGIGGACGERGLLQAFSAGGQVVTAAIPYPVHSVAVGCEDAGTAAATAQRTTSNGHQGRCRLVARSSGGQLQEYHLPESDGMLHDGG